MFGTLKTPLHGLRGTAGMTGLPHDVFDTLKAPLRGLRGTAAHLAYEEPTGLFASRLSSQAYDLTCHMEAPSSSSCADLRSQIRVAYGSGCTEESSSVAKYG